MRAVLFDLDDTLFDHRHSARHALEGLRSRYPEFARASITDLEARYSEALELVHTLLLRGVVSRDESRARRTRELFRAYHRDLDEAAASREYRAFRRDYDAARQVVYGTHALLRALTARGLRLGIVTNNLVSEQVPKLEHLGLRGYFDAVVISEAVNITKPDPRIFEIALERLEVGPREAVMVGDSISSDVHGALRADIRPVWLCRDSGLGVEPPSGVSTIDGDFGDTSTAIEQILAR